MMNSHAQEVGPAVVIGAAGAIGTRVTQLLLSAGRDVVAVDLPGRIPAAEHRAEDTGGQLWTFALDATSPEDVDRCFERITAVHGSISALVNAQGVSGRGSVSDVTPERFDHVLGVNLSSVFYSCRAAMPLLLRSQGVIVNFASVAGLRETPGSLAYAASKAGVVMLTRTLAADLARSGVRVHAICPTAIDSPMVRSNVPQSMLADYAASQPTGRLLTVDEIARVAVALIFSPLPYTPEPLVV